jgi:3-phosphoglycerate kinase
VLWEEAKKLTVKTVALPVDTVYSRSFPKSAMKKEDTKTFDLTVDAGIEDGWMGLDAGPKLIQVF